MGDCNHCTHERALSAEDDITVVFHKVDSDSHGTNSGGDDDDRAAERIHLRSNCRVPCGYDDDAPETEEERGSDNSPEDSGTERLCPRAFCVRGEPATREESAREGRREHALS